MAVESYKITVTGRVQGVFFRASTRDKAMQLGLSGFVCNREDGSVFIQVEGEQSLIDELVDWCRIGPRNARVDRVEVERAEFFGFKNFEVRR